MVAVQYFCKKSESAIYIYIYPLFSGFTLPEDKLLEVHGPKHLSNFFHAVICYPERGF